MVAKNKKVILSEHIKTPELRFGGLRKAARALEIDVAYLQRLKHGEKINPSPPTLKKLGIKKEVITNYYLK